jgi:hypothetical protein
MEKFKQKYVFSSTTINVILPFYNTILMKCVYIIGLNFLAD